VGGDWEDAAFASSFISHLFNFGQKIGGQSLDFTAPGCLGSALLGSSCFCSVAQITLCRGFRQTKHMEILICGFHISELWLRLSLGG
jgi:hypothetical protein